VTRPPGIETRLYGSCTHVRDHGKLKRDFESPKQGAISPADGGVIMPGISTEETAREESSGPRRAAQHRSGARDLS